jgi:hypothetical protein
MNSELQMKITPYISILLFQIHRLKIILSLSETKNYQRRDILMLLGDKSECLLCGAQTERSPYSDVIDPAQPPGGWKYECPNCGSYALPEQEHHWVEKFCSPDQRLMLFEYLRDNPADEGSTKIFTMEEIERILSESPPGEL